MKKLTLIKIIITYNLYLSYNYKYYYLSLYLCYSSTSISSNCFLIQIIFSPKLLLVVDLQIDKHHYSIHHIPFLQYSPPYLQILPSPFLYHLMSYSSYHRSYSDHNYLCYPQYFYLFEYAKQVEYKIHLESSQVIIYFYVFKRLLFFILFFCFHFYSMILNKFVVLHLYLYLI